LSSATAIIVVSPQTAELVAPHLRSRVSQVLAISYDEPLRQRQIAARTSPALRMLFAARCLDWKGLHLGLPAMARAVKAGADLHLTVVGDGPARTRWQWLADDLGIGNRISWL